MGRINFRNFFFTFTSALLVMITGPEEGNAAVSICIRTSTGGIAVRSTRCKSGEKKLTNISTLVKAGVKGATGPAGPSGSLRIFGDGSAGAKVVATSTTLVDTNLQYTDFTVDTGVTLTVESGTIIRCTGTFTNNGTINVITSVFGGIFDSGAGFNGAGLQAFSEAHPALSIRTAESGEVNPVNTTFTAGGRRGRGLTVFQAHQLFEPGVFGGGGGAGNALLNAFGGRGGGTIVVLAQKSVVNSFNAAISANGGFAQIDGTGGGAGGVIVLASPGSITNNGALNANGGAGGPSDAFTAPGGGGSGGIIHLVTPSVLATGTLSVTGGAAGTIGVNVQNAPRSGGGGGGSLGSVETGGFGGSIPPGANVAPNPAEAGGIGQAIVTLEDPTSLF